MTELTISELKEKLETLINEQISQFHHEATEWERCLAAADNRYKSMMNIAHELKSVENLIRLSDTTYPDLIDELLKTEKTKKVK